MTSPRCRQPVARFETAQARCRLAWPLARDAALGWFRDGAPSMGAALAFTLFSMAPCCSW
jgi:uncharacterized BrkB/YihY/UPF0761 family membrane protein